MSEYDVFPDAEAIAGWAMRTAGVTGGRVYSSIPNSPAFPLTILKRIGGQPAERHRLDAPRLQVEVWGTKKSEALDGAQLARSVIHSLEGQSVTTGAGAPVNAFITGVTDDLGLFWSPDPPTDRDRYIFGVRLYLHI
jgi:hypothetical protein